MKSKGLFWKKFQWSTIAQSLSIRFWGHLVKGLCRKEGHGRPCHIDGSRRTDYVCLLSQKRSLLDILNNHITFRCRYPSIKDGERHIFS
ncbi:hypothetical protein I3842_04G095700 [Carya illinoinensis]|uniref:Uncharacterized protein n=1 Tax=Carya illinoinensis TaxID=32201 RepID=A0A922FAS1_CARIL|nr:hypothetical protein I3842_04G095700 [Carya illinoinensis]